MPSLSLKASVNYPVIGGPSGPSYDPDASAWFSAVEATGANFGASPASISTNKTAFNTAFLSLKSAGIWNSIRQACFLVGPSTLQGALVNIKLTGNPVNYNFISADYNKLTGLDGDISEDNVNTNKYLDTGLNDSTDINGFDFHMLVDVNHSYYIPLSKTQYIFGSNNNGESGALINIHSDGPGNQVAMYANSWEPIAVGASRTPTFSRNGEYVTYYNSIFGWGAYFTDYADYWSGNNFLVFKTNDNPALRDALYAGEIRFYSLGTNTDVQSFVTIVDTLRNSLVN